MHDTVNIRINEHGRANKPFQEEVNTGRSQKKERKRDQCHGKKLEKATTTESGQNLREGAVGFIPGRNTMISGQGTVDNFSKWLLPPARYKI